jgi:hypothetical protein
MIAGTSQSFAMLYVTIPILILRCAAGAGTVPLAALLPTVQAAATDVALVKNPLRVYRDILLP